MTYKLICTRNCFAIFMPWNCFNRRSPELFILEARSGEVKAAALHHAPSAFSF